MASLGDMGAGARALVVETIAKIGRAYFVQKKPIKAIDLPRVSAVAYGRAQGDPVIRSEVTGFHCERGRQPLPRIDPWRAQLDGMLLANEGKSARERTLLSSTNSDSCPSRRPADSSCFI